MDWRLTTARFVTGVGFDVHAIPEMASQLLEVGYDTHELRALAGEDPRQSYGSDLEDAFRTALHEVGFLPMSSRKAAAILAGEVAGNILGGTQSELEGISEIWLLMDAEPKVRARPPFDTISASRVQMERYWPYHEAENKELVREYARQLIEMLPKEAKS